MNTAISSQWGFPKNCPANCPCKHYDCLSPEWQLRCGFSEGFCDMMVEPDVPEYKINWVRVYQNPDDETEKVGCSTPERPTRKWIEAHESMYKTASDVSAGELALFFARDALSHVPFLNSRSTRSRAFKSVEVAASQGPRERHATHVVVSDEVDVHKERSASAMRAGQGHTVSLLMAMILFAMTSPTAF
jgi:hypothetical protein